MSARKRVGRLWRRLRSPVVIGACSLARWEKGRWHRLSYSEMVRQASRPSLVTEILGCFSLAPSRVFSDRTAGGLLRPYGLRLQRTAAAVVLRRSWCAWGRHRTVGGRPLRRLEPIGPCNRAWRLRP